MQSSAGRRFRAREGLHVSAVVRKYEVQNHSDAAPGFLIVTGQRFGSCVMVLSRGSGSATLLISSALCARSLVLVFGSRIKTNKQKVDKSRSDSRKLAAASAVCTLHTRTLGNFIPGYQTQDMNYELFTAASLRSRNPHSS